MAKKTPEAFLKQFDDEYHNGGAYRKDSMLTGEAKEEGKSNHRAYKTDAMRRGALGDLSEADREFMEEASDEWDWEREYKEHGYAEAVKCIYTQTKLNLDNKHINYDVTLTRFYEKMNRLRRLYKNDRNKKRVSK